MNYWVTATISSGATAVIAFDAVEAAFQARALIERGAESVKITDPSHKLVSLGELEESLREPE